MSGEKVVRKFQQACDDVKQYTGLDHATLGYLYGHYKQATVGDCTMSAPSMWDITGNAKYQAWLGLKGMSTELAMTRYTTKVKALRKGRA